MAKGRSNIYAAALCAKVYGEPRDAQDRQRIVRQALAGVLGDRRAGDFAGAHRDEAEYPLAVDGDVGVADVVSELVLSGIPLKEAIQLDVAEDGQVRFLQAPALTTAEMAAITEQVRRRVLRWFARSGLLEPEEARDMLGWAHGGFSLDAAVRIAGPDRAGLERLLRYCARPPFALERLEQINPHQVIDHLPKPRRDGRTTLVLTPLELIDALAALVPPPRRHRHRYHGVLAPNSPLRAAVTAYGREETPNPQAPAKNVSATDEEQRTGSPARYLWAMRLARLFEALPLICPNCGANMRIIAFITEAAPVAQILTHIGEPPRPPPISPARGPPAWDEAPEPASDWDLVAQPEPELEFDQRITW